MFGLLLQVLEERRMDDGVNDCAFCFVFCLIGSFGVGGVLEVPASHNVFHVDACAYGECERRDALPLEQLRVTRAAAVVARIVARGEPDDAAVVRQMPARPEGKEGRCYRGLAVEAFLCGVDGRVPWIETDAASSVGAGRLVVEWSRLHQHAVCEPQ